MPKSFLDIPPTIDMTCIYWGAYGYGKISPLQLLIRIVVFLVRFTSQILIK